MTVPDSQQYLDPYILRTIPGTTCKAALPRRINPNYRNKWTRFKDWLRRNL